MDYGSGLLLMVLSFMYGEIQRHSVHSVLFNDQVSLVVGYTPRFHDDTNLAV